MDLGNSLLLRRRLCWVGLLVHVCLFAAPTASPAVDFGAMSLDELASIQVTSVSKKAERLNRVPAAISVITADDIRRSGYLTLPDLLRLVPGTEVARVDSSQRAVTVRGFNDIYAQKLLVLLDGRSVYAPLFSGTHWAVQDLMLEDIDRIELVRGPGSSVWGANAVNGVISVVSKPARATPGLLVSGLAGTEAKNMGALRYGGAAGEGVYYRVYGKYGEWNDSRLVGGGDANDAWRRKQAGFRVDWEPSAQDRLTLQGDYAAAFMDMANPRIVLPAFGVPPPAEGYKTSRPVELHLESRNLLGRWSRQLTGDADFTLQVYHDRTHFCSGLLVEERSTDDIDFRHRFRLGRRHEIVWGGGYRRSKSDLTDSVEIRVDPLARTDGLTNTFVQDEISLIPERLQWTLGAKFEHNDFTGSEFQPGTRLSWLPDPRQTVWVSVARAVRTPSQMEHNSLLNLAVLPPSPTLPAPTVVSASGNPNLVSEVLQAYELGYRVQVNPRLTVDAAGFLNEYRRLRGSEERLDLSPLPNFARVVSFSDNSVRGRTYGGELEATYQAAPWWRLHAQASLTRARLRQPANQLTGAPRTPSIASPDGQVSLRSSMDFGGGVSLDVNARHVGRIAAAGVAIPGQVVPSYTIPQYIACDVRLAWRTARRFEVSLVAQNLGRKHREFVPTYTTTFFTEVKPSAYLRLTQEF
jgi:iron complex outermembrane receptor protein